jgi:hypothetical protein
MTTSSSPDNNVYPLFQDEHPLFTLAMWIDDVMAEKTRLGYDDWVQEQMSKL